MGNLMNMQPDLDQGIQVQPTPIIAGQRIEIQYEGLLARSGAQDVFLHTGFGRYDDWQDVSDIQMQRQGSKFVSHVTVHDDTRLNFCFRDNAYNWDNNNGANWSFEIHNGKLY